MNLKLRHNKVINSKGKEDIEEKLDTERLNKY